jgi:hypothetical protein
VNTDAHPGRPRLSWLVQRRHPRRAAPAARSTLLLPPRAGASRGSRQTAGGRPTQASRWLRGRRLLSARCGEVGAAAERLVADREQVARDRWLPSQPSSRTLSLQRLFGSRRRAGRLEPRGHALGADLVAALGAEQRPLGTVPSRRSDEAGTAAGADGFLSPVHFRWRASSDLLAAELGP